MNEKMIVRLAQLIVIGMLVQLAVICYVFYSNYQGRANVVQAQRAGCERSKLDRGANAEGWRNAQKARIASGDFAVARRYGEIALGLELRSKINCAKAFSDAKLFP